MNKGGFKDPSLALGDLKPKVAGCSAFRIKQSKRALVAPLVSSKTITLQL
eukprot:CAMPEP_0206503084 /NCGR_PEP_ID=MMETSP0324_2-20121206/54454_1 /ASSEMBLY_ACC=CAM_ASM_000836 /TAXON_ID=2866 /ORGANISM="Crypthecodinium cohnii, Strain Seligo" /LENGTH=49 /DNA_ID= /DNA_START= /DNA_END= /DNA_ORIENTATION=